MPFLGLFGKKSGPAALKKHAARVANRRAQTFDRMASIRALGEIGNEEAVQALLERFGFTIDPGILDQDEKESAFQTIVEIGDRALVPVRNSLRKSETVSWPLKILDRITSPDEVIDALVQLLGTMDLEYERDPQKKIQVLSELEERRGAAILPAVMRFFDDVNETVRFHAAGAALAQDNRDSAREPLLATLVREESMRVRARILDGFLANKWDVGKERDTIRTRLPQGYALDAAGIPRRK